MAGYQNRQAYVANRIDLHFGSNTDTVGAVQSADISISFGLEAVSGLGSVRVIEYIPTLARIGVSTDQVYMFNREIDRIASGVASQASLMAQRADESLNGIVFDMSAVVLNASSDTTLPVYETLWKATACFLDSGAFRTAKHGSVGRSCQFQALDYAIAGATTTGSVGG